MSFNPDWVSDMWSYQDFVGRSVASLFQEAPTAAENERRARVRLGLLHILDAIADDTPMLVDFALRGDTYTMSWPAFRKAPAVSGFDVVTDQPSAPEVK